MTGKTLARWRASFYGSDGVPMTQAQAAQWYGVHERTWRGYENGRYRGGQVPAALVHLTKATSSLTVRGFTFTRTRHA